MEIRNYIFSSCFYIHNLCFTFFIALIISDFQVVQAGSFFQRSFPRTFQEYPDYQNGFDLSAIQPLPVREILSNNQGSVSPRSGKNKITPGIYFVDLNDIENNPSTSSRPRISSNSIRSQPFVHSVNRGNSGRSSKQFPRPAQSRNVYQNTRKKIKVERIEEIHERSLPAEITLNEILKIIPQVEAQFARYDKLEKEMSSEDEDYDSQNSQSYPQNYRGRKNKNSRTLSSQSKYNNRDRETDSSRTSREITYYYH